MLNDAAGPAPALGAICFTLPPEAVATYRAWRSAVDLAYLQAQITDQGWAMVIRLHGQLGFKRLTTLPDPGTAEPYYGTFGGGFCFHFRPHRTGCTLTVEPHPSIGLPEAPAEPSQTRRPIATPLELAIAPIELLAAPLAMSDPQGILDEQPDDPAQPWRFGLTGSALADLCVWGWDAALPAAYTYTFVPTSIGCIARVTDSHGVEIDLTGELS